jgi:hypothetical protein
MHVDDAGIGLVRAQNRIAELVAWSEGLMLGLKGPPRASIRDGGTGRKPKNELA